MIEEFYYHNILEILFPLDQLNRVLVLNFIALICNKILAVSKAIFFV